MKDQDEMRREQRVCHRAEKEKRIREGWGMRGEKRVQELGKSRLGVLVSQYHFAFMYIYTTFKNQLNKKYKKWNKKRNVFVTQIQGPHFRSGYWTGSRLSFPLLLYAIQQTLLSHRVLTMLTSLTLYTLYVCIKSIM